MVILPYVSTCKYIYMHLTEKVPLVLNDIPRAYMYMYYFT